MIAIVISTFNKDVTDGLLKGCLRALNENGYSDDKVDIHRVPGAFELPATVKWCTSQSKYNCIISLGAVIKGETDHYHYISEAVTNGIMSITLEDKLPNVLFGVLTCQNKELALARSGDDLNQNKGYEVGLAAASRLKP